MKEKIAHLVEELDKALRAKGRRGVDLGDPVSEQVIQQIEKKLGVEFPEDYRSFLKKYGRLGIADAVFFGIWMDEPESLTDRTVLGETVKLRTSYNLPHYLVPFYGEETYAYACMNCSPVPSDHKVVDFSPPIGEIQASKEAPTFEGHLEVYLQHRLDSLSKKI